MTGGLRGWIQCDIQTRCGSHPHSPNHYSYTLQGSKETIILQHNRFYARATTHLTSS